MGNENFEIKSALQIIELLKKYKSAKTQDEKDNLIKQMDDIDGFANRLLEKYSPDELIEKITKAISLEQYRPKNMPISLFAINKDLDYVNGEFDTFNRDLSIMYNNKENPKQIRETFVAGTANIYKLAKQFSADWLRRLNNHKDLVDKVRNADEENMVDAYNKLFVALTQDFCQEYGCYIDSRVITDWEKSDIKPKGDYDITDGFHKNAYELNLPSGISDEEKDRIKKDFVKNPAGYPNSHKSSLVRVNITNVKKHNQDKDYFFYKMISVFAHEIHHALDYQKPRQGALGPQIQYIDNDIYVPSHTDKDAYYKSATEISSYVIDKELYDLLKNARF